MHSVYHNKIDDKLLTYDFVPEVYKSSVRAVIVVEN